MLYSTYISHIKKLTPEMQSKVLIIARYFKTNSFKKDIRLCPSVELLNAYKSGDIDWCDFEREFKKEMEKQPMLQGLRDLYRRVKNGEDIILACYEKEDTKCHRRLIGEFLQQYGIYYAELQPYEFTETYFQHECGCGKKILVCGKDNTSVSREVAFVCPECYAKDLELAKRGITKEEDPMDYPDEMFFDGMPMYQNIMGMVVSCKEVR